MNCPSRTDDLDNDMYNQNPSPLTSDLTVREDFNGRVNSTKISRFIGRSDNKIKKTYQKFDDQPRSNGDNADMKFGRMGGVGDESSRGGASLVDGNGVRDGNSGNDNKNNGEIRSSQGTLRGTGDDGKRSELMNRFLSFVAICKKFSKFIGPGFMVSVAYIDPGNYSTGVVAGATYRYKLLFAGLMSNVFAIFLQILCIKLGSVTGLNLAEACRSFLPKWLNYFLYVLAELAIIATDLAEVIGTAIAINLLIPKIPLIIGCALSIIDVLFILLFYNPNGSMKGLRAFEFFVTCLVLGVVVCFCLQLSLIRNSSLGEILRGYLPSKELTESTGLYQACGILGATVMPHSLYLGSGLVQPRLQEYDINHGIISAPIDSNARDKEAYKPSLQAIRGCLKMFVVELTLSLFIFALFVNSAILITAGASLYGTDVDDADLFGIHRLLSTSLSPMAGTVFALALLLSGLSAGIVGTISGQMVSEGALNWTIRPWLRRLITRTISIAPSILVAAAVGKQGLNDVLNASQVVLSVVLPFITAPIIFFTCRNRYMTVQTFQSDDNGRLIDGEESPLIIETKMANHWWTTTFAVIIWLIIAIMNVANLVLLGKGV
ncbi:putative metal ion transporter metal ion transporter [Erysiphe necator]|uniref:Putative metal ion transporter metal ion transporter n=1 Tax=Uncinula necator TaxID=52586 RepID=A0A0B1P382_UNCNE|nr:putative metal ion transporter metal ion transporter [Erysiphe necator]